ncbi:hypothetical protein FPT84_25075 [Salmonella enterica]|uniref:Uncharacterized protein n=2 Tax=Salmonella enterica I TaxID=59201 RepID=A0A5U3G6W7_SALET|nr:hypothetical protein CHD70_25615 [Salmonella enterica]EBH9884139.1 hypothetical protein [Salmonella enterica subsp. enterica serovar Kisarawe]EBP4061020.1 hypothetical protein [Salmonella enterica subsp. enterica]EAA7570995.1 hypothetical protein [Salmonella enterica]EAS5879194.1 hypothetical protein [Salmonella enterica]
MIRQYRHTRECWLYFLQGGELAGWLGRNSIFERNKQAIKSGIFKMHVRLLNESPWTSRIRQPLRVCDNYLVYAQHWEIRNCYQIVALISPGAHQRVDQLLPTIIEIVESEFQSLNEHELKSLLHVTA